MKALHIIPAWLGKAGQIALALVLLALLWRAADGPQAARSLAAADVRWLAFGVLALTIQTGLSALRWRLTARQLGITLGRGAALREYYLSQVVNQSLPGGMIGDAGRALRSRGQAGLLAAGQAVIFERLAGQVAMFAMLATGFVLTLVVPGGLDWPRWLALSVAGLLTAGLCAPLVLWGARLLPGGIGERIAGLCGVLHRALLAREVLPWQIVFSLATTLCNIAAFAFCARAVGVGLGPGALAALVPLILVTMLVPLSVSGWGLREGAAAGLLPLVGVTASDGLAASVAFGLMFILAVLPGLILFWLTPRAERRGTGQTEAAQPDGTIRRGAEACLSRARA